MDFQLISGDLAALDMTFNPSNSILNNIIISVAIKKGTWWHDTSFGLLNRPRLKNTAANANLIRGDYEQALQWLLDAGRAKSITVTVSRDSNDRYRLNILISAVQADGQTVTYDTFKEVV